MFLLIDELLALQRQGRQLGLHVQVRLVQQRAHLRLLKRQQVRTQQLVLVPRLLERKRLRRCQNHLLGPVESVI